MNEVLMSLGEFFAYVLVAAFAIWKNNRAVQDVKIESNKNIGDMKHHLDAQLKKLNGTATYMIHSWPAGAWLKQAEIDYEGNTIFRMIELNEKYADEVGISRLEYIGKTDLEAGVPLEQSKAYYEDDLDVWARGGAHVNSVTNESGQLVHYIKIRLSSPDGDLKGVIGYELPHDLICPGLKNCPLLHDSSLKKYFEE